MYTIQEVVSGEMMTLWGNDLTRYFSLTCRLTQGSNNRSESDLLCNGHHQSDAKIVINRHRCKMDYFKAQKTRDNKLKKLHVSASKRRFLKVASKF